MENLINQSTLVRYKLDQIPELNYPECIDALQLLNYLLRRAETDKARQEIRNYIEQIDNRVTSLKQAPGFSEDGNSDSQELDY